jgi:hypothetical protein
MNDLTQEEAAKLLFMDVRTLQRKDNQHVEDPKLLAVMKYQEIMRQPNIDKAVSILYKHYKEIKGGHWE